MAYGYVDEHRLIRYRGGQARDITAFASDLQAVDDLSSLSVELTFGVITAPWDKYVEKDIVRPGDLVRVVNHDLTVFVGVVVTVALDGAVTAYDRGWYLNKSTIVLQVADMAADEAIRQACTAGGVAVARIAAMATTINNLWLGDTPDDIIQDILDTVSAETGKTYHRYVIEEGLVVEELPTAAIKAYHKPASNLAAYDITWALGQVTGEDSMDELRNVVRIAAEQDGTAYIGAMASNADSITAYGYLQHVESVTTDPGDAKLRQMAQTLLGQLDRIGRTRTVSEIWGCDEVRSGVVLAFNSPAFGLKGKYRVTRVTHHYGGAGHTMELEVTALEEPRAAGTTDTVSVYGLPDNIGTGGSSGGVTTGGASGSAAAFVAAAMRYVGYREGPNNDNIFGQWAGNNYAAWCVYFVCKCAADSSAPIPTGYGYVGDMSSYFQSRGLYRTVASGYIPKTGDLMIQGDRHIGIVRSATRSAVYTVEGNYSDSVATVTRYYSEISGFCTPWG